MIGSDPTIDYSKQGLNNRLQPEGGLADRKTYTTATEFQNNNEGGAVGNYNMGSISAGKINAGTIVAGVAYAGTLSFGQLKGGTATLGGSANGDGLLVVKDADGSSMATLNSTGLAVSKGSITIENTGGTTTLDASGVVSTSNFIKSEAVNVSLNQSITGTAITAVTGATLTFVLSRPSEMLFLADMANYLVEGVGDTCTLAYSWITLDGTTQQHIILGSGYNSMISLSGHVVKEVSAGTHTVNLYSRQTGVSGTPSFIVAAFKLSYLIFGT